SPLYRDAREDVRIERWAPGTDVLAGDVGGAEIFVLEGSFVDGAEPFSRLSWLRLPMGATARLTAGPEGARVWVKTGHLRWAGPPAI
ncbi:MAG: cupin, partial [Rubrimonas sp.]